MTKPTTVTYSKDIFLPTTCFLSIKHQIVITNSQRYFSSTRSYCKVIAKRLKVKHFTEINSEVKLGVIISDKCLQIFFPWTFHGLKGKKSLNL